MRYKYKSFLVIKNGPFFSCYASKRFDIMRGELNVAISTIGYQEQFTDPSWEGSVMVCSFPIIGITGCSIDRSQSSYITPRALVINNPPNDFYCREKGRQSLLEFCNANNKVLFYNINTRDIALYISKHGSQQCALVPEESFLPGFEYFSDADTLPQASHLHDYHLDTSCYKGTQYSSDKKNILFIDFGAKKALIEIFGEKFNIIRVTSDAFSDKIFNSQKFHGCLLSSGPGVPNTEHNINIAKCVLKQGIPVFGVCLGFQILACVKGAKVRKMQYGNHAANTGVQDGNGSFYVVATNHNYEIYFENDVSDIEVNMVIHHNNSIQSIKYKNAEVYGVQYHPEAFPGPGRLECISQFIKAICQKEKI